MSGRKKFFFQDRADSTSRFHCCVPRCSASARFNSVLSFYCFPKDEELRGKWLINIRREHLNVTGHSRVCGRHFQPGDVIEPPTSQGCRRLKKGAVPLLFEWNNYSMCAPGPSLWERRALADPPLDPAQDDGGDLPVDTACLDHNYCSAQPEALRVVRDENQKLKDELAALRRKMEKAALNKFGLERFAASDDDIRFYTRFESYALLMSFWRQIEPATKCVCLARGQTPAVPVTLRPIDEFFLFMTFLSLGLLPEDLASRFGVHKSAVISTLITWAHFLHTILGAISIWLDVETVKQHMPKVFSDYPDTHIILDVAELRCETPDSPLLHKPHRKFRSLTAMAPHGPVVFVSPLCDGSVGNRELLMQSGLLSLLQPSMAVMVDKDLLVEDLVPGKVHCPAFQSPQPVPGAAQRKTQRLSRLRAHIDGIKGRIMKHELFSTVIPLALMGCINQLFTVACLLGNYQNGQLKPQLENDL